MHAAAAPPTFRVVAKLYETAPSIVQEFCGAIYARTNFQYELTRTGWPICIQRYVVDT